MTQHHYIAQRFGTVSDEVYTFERSREPPIFDEIALGQRENEISVRDIDLPAAKFFGEDSEFDALHDVLRIVGTSQENRIGHAGHRMAGEAFSPTVAGRAAIEVLGAEAVMHVAAEHAVFDEDAPHRLVALVIHIDRPPRLNERGIVDDRA